ncbi:MAG: type II toxin-antitoxin system HicB family antitoxin [Chloroflexota bacterium]
MDKLSNRIVMHKEVEGGFTVIVPILPGCVTYGATIEEAEDMAREAILLYLESLCVHGKDILDKRKFLISGE